MESRYVRLRSEWLLRGWSDLPWALVNWKTNKIYPLDQESFYVAQSCDGQCDFSRPAFGGKHISLLQEFLTQGIAEPCRADTSLDPTQMYQRAENPMVQGVQWAITGLCNLRCSFCYMEAPTKCHEEMSFEQKKHLIRQFAEAGVSALSLTGGEPFVCSDLIEVIRQCLAERIGIVSIYTNGTLVTDAILKELRSLGIQPLFRISYDGCGAHDRMRGTSGIEPLVLDAIQRIRSHGFEVAVTTLVDNQNIDAVMATYEQMKGLDLQAWGVARPQPIGGGRYTAANLSLDRFAAMCTDLLERWLMDGRPFTLGLEAFFSASQTEKPAAAASQPFQKFACSSCREWPYLAPDGRLLPCNGFSDLDADDAPNLWSTNFSRAFSSAALRCLVDRTMEEVLAENPECKACEYLAMCQTGCRATAFVSNGHILAKDPLSCELWKCGYKKRFAERAAEYKAGYGNEGTIHHG